MLLLAAQAEPSSIETIPLPVLITSAVGAIAAALVIWGAVRNLYVNTVGRRRDRYRRLHRLGVGAQLPFFTAVLGEPPAVQRTVHKDDYLVPLQPEDLGYEPEGIHYGRESRIFTVSVFVDRDFFVQAVANTDQTVLAYSVTTRSKRFKPRFQARRPLGPIERWRWRRQTGERYRPLVDLTLGQTRFADLDSTDPDHFAPPHFRIRVGAHNFDYAEYKYFGNPGHYQSFAWAASDVARQGKLGAIMGVRGEIEGEEWPNQDARQQPEWSEMPKTQAFRRETTITTYTVISVELPLINYPLPRCGPSEHEVRTLI